jgi:tryptophan 2,3-dioxygenase
MDPRIEARSKEVTKNMMNSVKSYEVLISDILEKANNSAMKLARCAAVQSENLRKFDFLLGEEEKKVREKESELREVEKCLEELKVKNRNTHSEFAKKVEEINALQVDDAADCIEEMKKAKELIDKHRKKIAFYINIGKLKLDINETGTLKGKILKNHEALPFEFKKEANPFEVINEMWKIIS